MNFYRTEKFLITDTTVNDIHDRFKNITNTEICGRTAFLVTFFTKTDESYLDRMYGREKQEDYQRKDPYP